MYVWIWRHLPGGMAAKVVQTALLLFVIFPVIEPHLPFTHVTVNR